MKHISVKNFIDGIRRGKWLILLSVVLFCVLGAGFGYYKASHVNPDEGKEELDAYNTKLAEYESALAEMDKAIETLEGQIADLNTYNENSIYMQLNYAHIPTLVLQYQITGAQDTGVILNELLSYVNNGSLLAELQKKNVEYNTEYLRQVISSSNTGNVFVITVMHNDEEVLTTLRQDIVSVMEDELKKLEDKEENLSIDLIEDDIEYRAEAGVLDSQNGRLNDLRSYENSLKDQYNARVGQLNAIDNFKGTAPEIPVTLDVKKTAITYGVIGLAAGLLVPIYVLFMMFLFSNKVTSAVDLVAGGDVVLCEIRQKKTDAAKLCAMEILLQTKQIDSKNILLDLGKREADKFTEELQKVLKESDYNVLTENADTDDYEQRKFISECDAGVMLVYAGRTSYKEIEAHKKLYQRYGIRCLGFVVVC